MTTQHIRIKKPSILSSIWLWILGRYKNTIEGLDIDHITKQPVTVLQSYYKKSKKGSYRYYVWVMVCKEGIIHMRMPASFAPPKNALVLKKYPKGHQPRVFK